MIWIVSLPQVWTYLWLRSLYSLIAHEVLNYRWFFINIFANAQPSEVGQEPI